LFVVTDTRGGIIEIDGHKMGGREEEKSGPRTDLRTSRTTMSLYINGQKLQLLQGRVGGEAEPVRVEDERVKKKNNDDGAGPD
jgi:hypothetical protein